METHARKARHWRASLAIALMLGGTVAHAAGVILQNVNYAQSSRKVIVKGKLDGFAGPTTVTLRELSTGRQLAQTTAKNLQFGFQVYVPPGERAPCDIEVVATAGALTSHRTAQVRNTKGNCGSYTALLTGVVTDEAIPYATVTVTLDGVTYTTVADEFGNYTLPIASANLNRLLKIEAAGESQTGTPIEFTNLVGSFSRVLDEQQSNGSAKGNVTNVTTASYVLVLQANDGAEPTSEEELRAAETSVDATALLELAALIKLIVDDPSYSLPAGETSLLAFISNPTAVAEYLDSVPPEDLNAAIGEILADSNLVAGFSAQDIPSRYFVIPAATPGYLARQGSIIEFEAGTSNGRLLDYGSVLGQPINIPFSWSIENGQLKLTLPTPVVQTSYPTLFGAGVNALLTAEEQQLIADSGMAQVPVETRFYSFTYTRIADGALVDTVRSEVRADRRVPTFLLPNGVTFTPSLPPQELLDTGNESFRSSLDQQIRPFAATCPGAGGAVCVPGTWGAPFLYSPGVMWYGATIPEAAYGDVLTFSPGSPGVVSGLFANSAATWGVNGDGALVISYPNGWTQTVQIIDTLGIEYGAFSEFQRGDDRYATYSVHVKGDASLTLDEAYLANDGARFWQGEINSWLPGALNPDGTRPISNYFGWQFYAGSDVVSNVSAFELRSCDGGAEPDDIYANVARGKWKPVAGGAIEIDRFAETFPGQRLRSWYPIAATTVGGERQLYVIEVERNPMGRFLIAPRLNYQREIPAPWVCTN